jgi:hypothetical protein
MSFGIGGGRDRIADMLGVQNRLRRGLSLSRSERRRFGVVMRQTCSWFRRKTRFFCIGSGAGQLNLS